MRKTNEEIKNFLNNAISKNPNEWKYQKGANFGIALQEQIGLFFEFNKEALNISKVEINTNPNDEKADIVLHYQNETSIGIEIKSCKDGALNGVTICNAPHLLNDKAAFLINYTVQQNSIIEVLDVYETQIFRLTSICKKGKYKGCLISTRDTGKKIKGRSFADFINTEEKNDYTLAQLTEPNIIRKTILYYSASKLVDDNYIFSDEEILDAIHNLRKNN